MPAITCPVCGDDDLTGVEELRDGRRVVRCLACDHEWIRGESHPVAAPVVAATYESLRTRFPRAEEVSPAVRARVRHLAAEFRQDSPPTHPDVAPYWAKYQDILSADGLWTADPEDLKVFANNSVGAHPGNMSVFNNAWNEMGSEKAAARLRATIDHLLRGPADIRLEDRFTDLVEERKGLGMTGFKESLLTRVLCVVEPDRFLRLLKYSTPSGGKKEIAGLVFGLELPERERVSWTIGRLVTWSNDLLVDLLKEEFTDLQRASQFLWWAKDRAAEVGK